VKDFFKLSYPAHEKTPFLANCVELRENKKYGRGLFATRDLKPGDVIAVDESFVKALNRREFHKRCTNCLEVRSMNLMPCSGCVSAMFCSKKCQDEAMEKFHQFECPHLDSFELFNCFKPINDFASLSRTFFEARHAAGGLDKLKAICADKEIQQKTFFDYDLSKDNNPSLELNQFLAAIGQISLSIDSEVPVNLLDKTVINRWINQQPFRSVWKTPDEKKDVKQILMQLCDLYQTIFKEFSGPKLEEVTMFGSSVNLVMPYFNYSCAPNVSHNLAGNQLVHIVDFPIKKGEAILQSFGE